MKYAPSMNFFRRRSSKTAEPMGWRGLPQTRTKKEPESVRTRELALARTRVKRVNFVFAVIVGAALLLGYRLFYWQVLAREETLAKGNQTIVEEATTPVRGTIRDRNGYLLAADDAIYKFWVSPNIVSRPELVAEEINGITGIPEAELIEIFGRDSQNELISDTVPLTMAQEIINLEERFFVLEPSLLRTYPNGTLAAHLLGFVNFSDEEGRRTGVAGVEMYYDKLLSGMEIRPLAAGTPAEEIKLGSRPFTPTQNGVDLVLTIDRSLQFMVEQELNSAIQQYQALGGTIVVMDPKTGDILAMASSPTFEPERFRDWMETPEIFNNPAVSQQYEPGSVFKIITVAAAIDAGTVTPETRWYDPGVYEVGGRIITNWDGRGYGDRSVTEILGYSLNTGTAWISTSLGPEQFYSHMDSFGFGSPTGIDLGSEAAGQVKSPGDGLWHPSDLGTNAFGQGIAVTPLQMVTAVASLLNDGQLMQPRVVKAVINNGVLEELPVVVRGQSVSPETAHLMQTMMADAVEIETQTALLDGWRVGGKTGTAQVPIPGGYHATDTIASFIGFAPADDPAFVMLVKLDRPLGVHQWGSQSAAPTFNRLATRILNYFNIPPDMYRVAVRPAVEAPAPEAQPISDAAVPEGGVVPADGGGTPPIAEGTIPLPAPPPEPTPVIP
jgi:cell division protein FtsI/penicillin-binding protein 2